MRIPVPFPFSDRHKSHFSKAQIREAARESVERSVPISLLYSGQRTIGADRLAQYEETGADALPSRDGSPGHSPLVVIDGNRLELRNGNHRAVRAALRGDRSIRARVASPKDRGPRLFREKGHAGELLLIHPEAMALTYREHDVEDVATVIDGIGCVTIDGPLEQKPDGSWWCFFDDYESILCRYLNAIHSDEVRAVLLKIDSPGGAASGLNECVDAMIRAKRETGKPVIAYADEGAYSAAYAIACAADEIYLPRAGGLGSIGVVSMLVDWSKANEKDGIRVEVVTSGDRKADGNPNVPMSSEAIRHVQRRVDGLAKIYWKLVAQSRGIDAKPLEADTFYGKDAVRKGLADGIMSLEALMGGIREGLDKGTLLRSTSRAQDGAQRHSAKRASTMSAIVKLTHAVKSATAAVAKAEDKEAALAELALAEAALGREMAKVTKDKKTTTVIHESESSSEEESHSSSSGGSSSSEEEEESKSSSSSEEEEEEKMPEDEKALVKSVLKLTGSKSAREALGAMAALAGNSARTGKDADRIARLEAKAKAEKVERMIDEGKKALKITPGNEDMVREIARAHGTKALKAFINAAAPAFDARNLEPTEEIDGVSVTAEQKKMWTKLGYAEKDFPKLAKSLQKELARAAGKMTPKRGDR